LLASFLPEVRQVATKRRSVAATDEVDGPMGNETGSGRKNFVAKILLQCNIRFIENLLLNQFSPRS
jgi:hypothetical protein